jgi:uracil-DNA glycosylase
MIDWIRHDDEVIACNKCPRLVSWRQEIAKKRRRAYQDQEYWGKPVPGFGDLNGAVLAVGLAPGAHGSNRTGRMFTGDRSGDFLYQALFDCGFANQPTSLSKDDGLTLSGIYISAVCRCVPPQNKPTLGEIQNCLPFLLFEARYMTSLQIVVALGKVAFDQTMRILKHNGCEFEKKPFSHGITIKSNTGGPVILGSYHPSQQNTQTGRLTYPMFLEIWQMVREMLSSKYSVCT